MQALHIICNRITYWTEREIKEDFITNDQLCLLVLHLNLIVSLNTIEKSYATVKCFYIILLIHHKYLYVF